VGVFRKVLLHRTVIVNLTNGDSISGVLYRDPGNLLVLMNAVYLHPGTEPAPLDGETVIERTQVLFVQAP
jgi:small nuclear ribonucleoprotein (snRNP)-like protein